MAAIDTRKELTCWWWNAPGYKCKYGPDHCKYSHRRTGKMGPRSACPILPRLSPPSNHNNDLLTLDDPDSAFSARNLAWALQSVHSAENIQHFINKHPPASIDILVNSDVEGYPPIFYAIERNCTPTLGAILENGGSPNSISSFQNIPALAFAICHAEVRKFNTVSVVKMLLAYGADPKVIPQEMWEDYIKVPSLALQRLQTSALSWCTPELQALLVRNLNISQRYYLHKAYTTKSVGKKMIQAASIHGIKKLLTVPYYLVGQSIAADMVLERLIGHFALNINRPIVMVFCGPSGHGKTALAKEMGGLLNIESLVIDCTEMQHETDLFGPKAPYFGSGESTSVNNLLAAGGKQRCIVLLDEFEKTTDEVRQALLLIFDWGHYKDRRNGNLVDCSRVIWILTTNAVDSIIAQFFHSYLEDRSEEAQTRAPFRRLDADIKELFISKFGVGGSGHLYAPNAKNQQPPTTGRLTVAVPFFPFQAGEQAVVAHQFILNLSDNVRKPIDIDAKKLAGHVRLSLQNDSAVTSYLAKIGYDGKLGARSLQRAVDQHVLTNFYRVYFGGDDEVSEKINRGPLQKYSVKLCPVFDGKDEVVVYRNGYTDLIPAE